MPKPASKAAAAPPIKGSLLPRDRTQKGVIPTRPGNKPLLPRTGAEKTSRATTTQMPKSRLTKPAKISSRGKQVRKEAESKPADPGPQDFKQDAVQNTFIKDPVIGDKEIDVAPVVTDILPAADLDCLGSKVSLVHSTPIVKERCGDGGATVTKKVYTPPKITPILSVDIATAEQG